MASSSTSSNNTVILRVESRMCFCGVPASVEISRSTANPGRIYYSCRSYPNGCRYWCWLIPNRGDDRGRQPEVTQRHEEFIEFKTTVRTVEQSTKAMKLYILLAFLLCMLNCILIAVKL